MLYFNYFTNPCQPDKGRISAIIEQPKTVWQIIKEQKVDLTMPILCLINGAPVLRKDWGNVFDDGMPTYDYSYNPSPHPGPAPVSSGRILFTGDNPPITTREIVRIKIN